jgi:predicted ATPase
MLERINLRNFKSIKDYPFDLENLTLFSGLNGMGKSSVLQSLLLLRQSYEAHLLPDTGISLTGEYVRIGTGKDLLFTDANDEFIDIELFWSASNLSFRFKYQEKSDMQPIERRVADVNGNPFVESLFTSAFQYLSAERLSPKSIYDVSDYAVNQRRSLGIKGEYTPHFLAEHGNEVIAITALRHKDSVTGTLIDNLNAWMSEITPGTKVIAKLIPEINKASLHYQFASSTQMTAQFRPENTGFGLTYVLPVVTSILSARQGDLLLIENPESHLHPAGQSLVARLIAIAAQNGVQVIIETHSDHFLNGIRISIKNSYIDSTNVCAFFLYRDMEDSEHAAKIEEVRIDPTGRIDYWPSGFFDEWEKSLDALIMES